MVDHGTITVNGDTAVQRVDQITADYAAVHISLRTSVEDKWVGACPAGVVAGARSNAINGPFKTFVPPPAYIPPPTFLH